MGKSQKARQELKQLTKQDNRVIKKQFIPKETPRQKGDRLEVQTYNKLVSEEYVVTRTRDGHFKNIKYVPTGDEGIDIIATNKEGITIYVQCKNWEAEIGVNVIRTFAGAISKYIKEGNPGIGIIVGNYFTTTAQREASCMTSSVYLTTLENINKPLKIYLKKQKKEKYKSI